MNTAYIVTEGQLDSALISQLLPDLTDKPESVKVITGQGYSSALALAQSVLFQTGQPALLLVDADTNDLRRVKEKQEFIEEYIKVGTASKFKVLLAVPTLEAIFFEDKTRDALESVIGKSISDEVWELAKLSPKQALSIITGRPDTSFAQLLTNETLRQRVEDTSLIKEIRHFIGATA